MAFTLQFPNTIHQRVDRGNEDTRKMNHRYMASEYKEKINFLSPALSVQADVLYPNAWAAVHNLNLETDNETGTTPPLAAGCKGNQLDNEFPLKSRVPVALPLVQYPTDTRGSSTEDQDMCALPVMNWEKYVTEFRVNASFELGRRFNKRGLGYGLRLRLVRNALKITASSIRAKAARWAAAATSKSRDPINPTEPIDPDHEYKHVPDIPEVILGPEGNDDNESTTSTLVHDGDDEKTVSESTDHKELKQDDDQDEEQPSTSLALSNWIESYDNGEGALIDIPTDEVVASETCPVPGTSSPLASGSSTLQDRQEIQDSANISSTQPTVLKSHLPKQSRNRKNNYYRTNRERLDYYLGGMSRHSARKILYHTDVDLEAWETENIGFGLKTKTLKVSRRQVPLQRRPMPKLDIRPQPPKPESYYGRVGLTTLRKYKNQPEVKLMGTWNFLYGGNGACDWVFDSQDSTRRNIFVGNGSKMRMISIKPAKSISMLSFVVDSVWEEENVPTNIRPEKPEKDDAFSDLIFRILSHRKRHLNLTFAQRGRSIEIYRVEGIPTLLTSIPNICYGTKRYLAGSNPPTRNPLIVSFDANPYYESHIITLDQNNIIRIVDFTKEKTKKQFTGAKILYKAKRFDSLPEFRLNEASGVAYANHPFTYYQWYDSQIYFHDDRIRTETRVDNHELLDLRSSTSSLSWSDQQYFVKYPQRLLEYVSNVKPSSNSTYYYVGTSSRVLLMDMRVPGNPVLKMSHGMKSPAAYIDTLKGDDFEVVVAGSQRVPQIFCSTHDFSHISCIERTDCKARNPILESYPHHLSNSRDFFEYATTEHQNLGFGFESDYQRAKDHCYAWSTGLCVMPSPKTSDPKKPPGVIVLNGNSFGDVFYQEWDQKPLEPSREIEKGSRKLKQFALDWRKAMTPKSLNEFHKPSLNKCVLADCSLLIEPNAEKVKHAIARTEPFDPFKPFTFTFNRVSQGLKPISDQIKQFKRYKGPLVGRVLNPWLRSEGLPLMPRPDLPGQIQEEMEGQEEFEEEGIEQPEQDPLAIDESDILQAEGQAMFEHQETNNEAQVMFEQVNYPQSQDMFDPEEPGVTASLNKFETEDFGYPVSQDMFDPRQGQSQDMFDPSHGQSEQLNKQEKHESHGYGEFVDVEDADQYTTYYSRMSFSPHPDYPDSDN